MAGCCKILLRCCILAPIMAITNSLLLIIPVFLIAVVGSFISCLLNFIPDIVYTYRMVIKTPRIGRNLSVICMILLPIPLLLYPIVILLLAIGTSIIGTFAYCFVESYASIGDEDDVTTQIKLYYNVVTCTWDAMLEFWEFNSNGYFAYLKELCEPNANHVYEVTMCQCLVILFISLIGMVIDGIIISLMLVVKTFFAIFQLWKSLTKMYADLDHVEDSLVCFIPYMMGMTLSLPLCFLGLACGIVCSFLGGVNAAICACTNDSIRDGLRQIFINIYQIDQYTNELIFDSETSWFCFGCCNFQLHGPGFRSSLFSIKFKRQNHELNRADVAAAANNPVQIVIENNILPSAPPPPPPPPQQQQIIEGRPSYQQQNNNNLYLASQLNSVQSIWNSFFDMCVVLGKHSLEKNLISKDDIESKEPFVIIGVPALVIFNSIYRSKDTIGILLNNGMHITEQNRPSDIISTQIYDMMIRIKEDIQNANITDAERHFMEKKLVTLNDDEKCKTPYNIDAVRAKGVMTQICGKIISMATNTTRMPTFNSKFANSLNQMIL
jgi:hypothetical protein